MSVLDTRDDNTLATMMELIRTRDHLCHDPRCKLEDCCAQDHTDVWIFRENGEPLHWYWLPFKKDGTWVYRMSDDFHLIHIIGHPHRSFLRYDPVSGSFVDARLTECVEVQKSVDLLYLATDISPVNASGLQKRVDSVDWQFNCFVDKEIDRSIEKEDRSSEAGTLSSPIEYSDGEGSSPARGFQEDQNDIVPTSEPLEEVFCPSSD